MPITEAQLEIFANSPLPKLINFTRGYDQIHRGKEALVMNTITNKGRRYALKWYASLEGMNIEDLVNYGRDVNDDETLLSNVGLNREKVLDSHFWITEFNGRPQLFAIQRFAAGKPLKEVSVWEIMRKPLLCKSLAEIFINCERSYKLTGRQPDLTGGKRINIFGRDVVEPLVFLWPFRTTNIIVEDDRALIVDAKALAPDSSLIKRLALLTNRTLSLLFARGVLMYSRKYGTKLRG